MKNSAKEIIKKQLRKYSDGNMSSESTIEMISEDILNQFKEEGLVVTQQLKDNKQFMKALHELYNG